MSESPLITIIVPTHNRAHLVKRALISIQRQIFSNFVVEVWDNCSEDNTAEVVTEFERNDPRIRYHRRETNVGMMKNFSQPMLQVTTPYFCYLSDDDFWLPKFLSSSLEELNRYPDAGFSVCNHIVFQENGPFFKFQATPGYYPAAEGTSYLFGFMPFFFGCLFRKKVISKLNGINESIGFIFDLDFIFKCSLHFPYVINNEAQSCMQSWKGSVTTDIISNKIELHFQNLENLKNSIETVMPNPATEAIQKSLRFQVANFFLKHFSDHKKMRLILSGIDRESFGVREYDRMKYYTSLVKWIGRPSHFFVKRWAKQFSKSVALKNTTVATSKIFSESELKELNEVFSLAPLYK